MRDIERRLRRLEGGVRSSGPEDERQREEERERIRQGAERLNGSHFRDLASWRRAVFLESVGYDGHSAEDLGDENFLYPDDELPFTIAEDGGVFSARDGKPITDFAQTLAEVWYWQEVEWGGSDLVHDEEAEAFYTPNGELALSRDRVNLQHYLSR